VGTFISETGRRRVECMWERAGMGTVACTVQLWFPIDTECNSRGTSIKQKQTHLIQTKITAAIFIPSNKRIDDDLKE